MKTAIKSYILHVLTGFLANTPLFPVNKKPKLDVHNTFIWFLGHCMKVLLKFDLVRPTRLLFRNKIDQCIFVPYSARSKKTFKKKNYNSNLLIWSRVLLSRSSHQRFSNLRPAGLQHRLWHRFFSCEFCINF